MSSHARPGNSHLVVSDWYLNVKISGAFTASGNQYAVKPHYPKVIVRNVEDIETFNVVSLKSEWKRALQYISIIQNLIQSFKIQFNHSKIIIQESSLLLSSVAVLTGWCVQWNWNVIAVYVKMDLITCL